MDFIVGIGVGQEPDDLTAKILQVLSMLLTLGIGMFVLRSHMASKKRDTETRSLLQVDQSMGCKVDHTAISQLLRGLAEASQKQTEANAGLSMAVMQLSLQTTADAKASDARHNEMLRMMAQQEARHSEMMVAIRTSDARHAEMMQQSVNMQQRYMEALQALQLLHNRDAA
jgi:hypothetical protein